MPWKEGHVMDERLRFVARLLEGEKMAPLCAAFGISRKTGYKILRAVQRLRDRRVHRSQSAAVSAGESAAGADRGDDRPVEAGVSGLGRAEDPGEAPAAGPGRAAAGDQYGPRGARPPRLGQAAPPPPARGRRHCALAPDGAECP